VVGGSPARDLLGAPAQRRLGLAGEAHQLLGLGDGAGVETPHPLAGGSVATAPA